MTIVTLKRNMIRKLGLKPSSLLSMFELFSYPKDNPSRKRDARCTNILHTGATLSGVGEGQRLRKGFQRQRRGSVGVGDYGLNRNCKYWYEATLPSGQIRMTVNAEWGILPVFESLSSAAEIRHSARNTRL